MSSDHRDRIRAGYDAWSSTYDGDENPTRDLDARVLRSLEIPLSGSRVLELGCGTGKNTPYLAAEAASLTALDLSPLMLERARGRPGTEGVKFREHDVLTPWPVGDADLDLVVGDLVLEHVDNVGFVAREAARVLVPGGLWVVIEYHPARQMLGKQARFSSGPGPERTIPAFFHPTSEYLAQGLEAGFRLRQIDEWTDDDRRIVGSSPVRADDPPRVPRILSIVFEKT